MTGVAATTRSLTRRLLGGMVLPLIVLAVALGVGGALAISQTVEAVNDRILGAASRGIADSLAVEDGEVTLDLSPAIFGMLENNARDNVYYSVRQGNRMLTGYDDLPQIAIDPSTGLAFGRGEYLGRPVRIAAEQRTLPRLGQPVVVEVAETLDARERTTRGLLLGLALLEVALVALVALLVPLAVRWGLRPLDRIRAEMDRRVASDMTPLPSSRVPSELRDLVLAFNAMLVRLDAGMQGVRRFTADASHQMRTPLSVLRTHVEVLKTARPGSEEARGSIEDIAHASERLSRLLAQLLSLARADSPDAARSAFQVADLNAVVRAAAGEHALDAVRAGVELRFDASLLPAPVLVDVELATELLSNIVDNAIRYNRRGGEVRISVDASGPQVSVQDDGPGIAAADRERAFERFTRLTRQHPAQGSGLGLSIARSIAAVLDARLVLATPVDGTGLCVEVTFRRPPDSLVTG